jgi:hypothetical protein
VIKELKEPESSRKLPKSEQILILSASKFNGEKFPPWTREIGPQDFVQLAGEAMFRGPTDMSLSKHQKQNLRDWARAPYALPPPSWCSERDGLFPAMVAEKPIDLVQDAASDCSVVASLCAERARVEKGHQSVSLVDCLLEVFTDVLFQILSKVMFPYSSKTKGPAISPNGKYMFRFNFNGCYRLVVVDDRLPVSKSKRILHIIDRNNPCLLWPALVEKAYLKVRGGYDFPGSNSNTDLWIIAGWIPEQVFLQQ